jgi:hypothetical protein
VARDNLARMEDLALLRHLLTEARREVDDQAGPDRERQISALRRRDVRSANQELAGAQSSLWRAKDHRERAEAVLEQANTRPARARLPGLLGNEARREAEPHWQQATRDFDEARRVEQEALRTYERAHHGLEEAERAARELDEAHAAQGHRESWLREHPITARWISQLEERVSVREYEEHEIARTEERGREVTRVRRAGPAVGRGRPQRPTREASPGEAALRAVLARCQPGDLGYGTSPPPPRSPEREGPSLER